MITPAFHYKVLVVLWLVQIERVASGRGLT